uniref:WAP four-disulfide core domain protein 1 n=1 Tax=Leptobrachium leishanense TaxID=445787 RepID=A0A8C5QQB3_9ANUR
MLFSGRYFTNTERGRAARLLHTGTGVYTVNPDILRCGLPAVSPNDCVTGSQRTCRADYEYPHNTNYQKNDRCPPPPQTLPERACEVPSCRSDSECERHKRCCYNGCIYACLESVQPPPVLDWLVQPKPRWLGGNGWLLDGPEEVLQAEACSTTEDGDEPLHCPTGYECHIINPGSPSEGIPNRGQCIKQKGNTGQCPKCKLTYFARNANPLHCSCGTPYQ